jgi:type VI secretion system protein ImpK
MSPPDSFSEMVGKRTKLFPPNRSAHKATAIWPPQTIDSQLDKRDYKKLSLEPNPLVSSSFSILSLLSKLRYLPFNDDILEFKERMIGQVTEFETQALKKGAFPTHVETAKYLLCTFADETVLNTPWGSQGGWGLDSLSNHFFKEMMGGERFFEILNQLKQQPNQNLDILEFAFFCLSLGFEGKYRHAPHGSFALDKERQELYLLIQKMKGDSKPDLSIHWKGVDDLSNPVIRIFPLWVFAVVACVLLMMVYMGFFWEIGKKSNQTYSNLINLAKNVEQPKIFHPNTSFSNIPNPIVQVSATDKWKTILKEEINQNKVTVLDGPIIRISDSFESGSSQIKKDYESILAKIARELENGSTRIKVVGHTDSQQIKFAARFKSNWHLSVARAENVAYIIGDYASFGERISFEGMADQDPIEPNDTQNNRARNRRIEIHILPGEI